MTELKNFTVAQLREYADSKGINITDATTKKELISIISESDQSFHTESDAVVETVETTEAKVDKFKVVETNKSKTKHELSAAQIRNSSHQYVKKHLKQI